MHENSKNWPIQIELQAFEADKIWFNQFCAYKSICKSALDHAYHKMNEKAEKSQQ